MPPDVRPSPPAPPFRCDPRVLRVAVFTRQQALGLSQQSIAQQTGLSEPRLSRFLTGAELPSDQTVNRLVHWLDLPLAYFNLDEAGLAEPARAIPAA